MARFSPILQRCENDRVIEQCRKECSNNNHHAILVLPSIEDKKLINIYFKSRLSSQPVLIDCAHSIESCCNKILHCGIDAPLYIAQRIYL